MHYCNARYVLQSIKTTLSHCQLVYEITKNAVNIQDSVRTK